VTATQALKVFTFGRDVRLPNGKNGTVVGSSLGREFGRLVLYVKCSFEGKEKTWPHYDFPAANE